MKDQTPNPEHLSTEEKRAYLAQLLRKKARRNTMLPLSYGQKALWFYAQMEPDSSAYNAVWGLKIEAQYNSEALKNAFQHVLDRHEAFRTRFVSRNGIPFQQVADDPPIDFECVDVSHWSETVLNEAVKAESQRPFNLEQDRLLRVRLYVQSEQEALLLIVIHHIVFDLWTLTLLLSELSALYEAEVTLTKSSLLPVVMQYGDFVGWQEKMIESAEGEKLWAFWKMQMAGEPSYITLPADYPRPDSRHIDSQLLPFQFSAEITQRIKHYAQSQEVTLYTLLLAVYYVWLYRYTGQEDLVVASSVLGKRDDNFARTLGYFVNTVLFRSQITGTQSFDSFLAAVHTVVMDGLAHQDFPFSLLVERLNPPRDTNRPPLANIAFTLQTPPAIADFSLQAMPMFGILAPGKTQVKFNLGGLQTEFFQISRQIAEFDIELEMMEIGGILFGGLHYNSSIFRANTIQRLVEGFQNLMQAIIDQPEGVIEQFPLLQAQERTKLIALWNVSRWPAPRESFIEQFEAQVDRTPHTLAVLDPVRKLSYEQLNREANGLSWELRALHITTDSLIGILLERSVTFTTAILAVFKAGGAYLPLDPQHPAERIAQILLQSRPAFILTDSTFMPLLETACQHLPPGQAPRLLNINALLSATTRDVNPPVVNLPDALAYVIFTSGSTGVPKGAMVTQKGMNNHLFAKNFLTWI